MNEPVPVRVGDCRCPGTPHTEGDHVYLAPRLTATAGAAATAAVNATGVTVPDIIGALAGVFMAHCIVRWDFLMAGEKVGTTEDVPINRLTIDEYLPWGEGGSIVTEACDGLYAEDFLRPLGLRPSRSSAAGQTEPSTSATRPSGPKRPKRSRRSS